MKFRAYALAALAFVLVTACASENVPTPYNQVVLSNSAGISYEYANMQLSEIGTKASMHCSSESKRAVLQSTSTLGNGNQLATFVCK